MRPGSLAYEAVMAVAGNRFRTMLALLGIAIGVGSVIAIVGLGDGAKVIVRDALSSFGAGSLLVMPNFRVIEASDGRFEYEAITRDDIAQIHTEAEAVRAVTPQILFGGRLVRHASATTRATLYGTLHHYLEADDVRMAAGRFLSPDDDRLQRKVAVLGAEVASELFPETNPLGAFVNVENLVELEVVGVLEPEEQSFLSVIGDPEQSNDTRVFVPASSVERIVGEHFIFFLSGEAESLRDIKDAKQQILAVLTANHGRFEGGHPKFVVQELAQLLETIDSATGTITALISILGAIALLVAGIGVMNIMLVSVRERTQEIGTRKALGAQQAAILNQFMVEAVIICGGGGIAGVGLAAAAILTVSVVTQWPALISLVTVRLAFLLSFGTGLVFGLYPAGRAARMDPVEALRHE